MTFAELERRFLALLNEKVRRGEISQRQLARLAGFSQPHIHNVLKGARGLNREVADALLGRLELSLSDLVAGSGHGEAGHASVALWRGSVGRATPFPDAADPAGALLFPASFLCRFTRPVLLCVGVGEDVMSPLIQPGDLVLVDRAERSRRRPVFDSIYVI